MLKRGGWHFNVSSEEAVASPRLGGKLTTYNAAVVSIQFLDMCKLRTNNKCHKCKGYTIHTHSLPAQFHTSVNYVQSQHL